jgi:hypothetical protein
MSREVQGIGAGATISTFSQRTLVDYGIAKLGYTFRLGILMEFSLLKACLAPLKRGADAGAGRGVWLPAELDWRSRWRKQ